LIKHQKDNNTKVLYKKSLKKIEENCMYNPLQSEAEVVAVPPRAGNVEFLSVKTVGELLTGERTNKAVVTQQLS
jgi:hypothetical protein